MKPLQFNYINTMEVNQTNLEKKAAKIGGAGSIAYGLAVGAAVTSGNEDLAKAAIIGVGAAATVAALSIAGLLAVFSHQESKRD